MTIVRSTPLWLQHLLDAAACLAVGSVYFALAWLSTHLTPRAGDIAYLWPAGGFVLGLLLVAPKRAHDEKLIAALKPLVGAIDVKTMREANLRGSQGTTPDAVAKWLAGKITK